MLASGESQARPPGKCGVCMGVYMVSLLCIGVCVGVWREPGMSVSCMTAHMDVVAVGVCISEQRHYA